MSFSGYSVLLPQTQLDKLPVLFVPTWLSKMSVFVAASPSKYPVFSPQTWLKIALTLALNTSRGFVLTDVEAPP